MHKLLLQHRWIGIWDHLVATKNHKRGRNWEEIFFKNIKRKERRPELQMILSLFFFKYCEGSKFFFFFDQDFYCWWCWFLVQNYRYLTTSLSRSSTDFLSRLMMVFTIEADRCQNDSDVIFLATDNVDKAIGSCIFGKWWQESLILWQLSRNQCNGIGTSLKSKLD